MFKKVLLCHDGSDNGRRALKSGAELAILLGAHVDILLTVPGDAMSAAVMAGATGHVCLVDEAGRYKGILQESVERIRARGVDAKGYLAYGNSIQQIVAYSKKLSIDLIIIGHYPNSEGRRWWSGRESASLAEQVNCCILIAVDAAGSASA